MENSANTRGLSPPRTWIVLGLIVFAALALRLFAIGHGLPFVVGPDEGFEIHRALKLGLGEFDFSRIAKGGFFYLLFVEYGVYFVVLKLTGAIEGAGQFAEKFATDISPFWLIARVTHAVIGGLTCVITYLVGRAYYHSAVGLLAAGAVAVSSLHVGRSLYVGVDIPMTFLVMLVFILLLRWKDRDATWFSVLLGSCVGFAVMTKLPAIILVFPILVAAMTRGGAWSWRGLWSKQALVVYGAAAVVFALGNPGFILGFFSLVVGLFQDVALGGEGEDPTEVFGGGGSGRNLWLFYSRALVAALGRVWLLLSILGAACALVRRRREDLLILSFAIPFFLVIAGSQSSHLYYPRYIMPLVPLLSILAAWVLWTVVTKFATRPPLRFGIAAGAAALLLTPNLVESVGKVADFRRGDTRVQAREWIEANVPAGSTVFLVGNPIVDTAPNLSLPLRDSNENMRRLANAIRDYEPAQARFLDTRRKLGKGVPYRLHAVRHYESVPSYDELLSEGVEIFALVGDLFDDRRLKRDTRHSNRVLSSRLTLREELASGAAERIFLVDPEETGLTGPWVEIYEAKSTSHRMPEPSVSPEPESQSR